jgi:hypothetical protein
MRRNQTQNIGDVIGEYLRVMNVDGKLKEMRVIRSWYEICGKTISKATTNVTLKNRVLWVSVNSSIIRAELLMIKQGLISRINEEAGSKMIDDIVIR